MDEDLRRVVAWLQSGRYGCGQQRVAGVVPWSRFSDNQVSPDVVTVNGTGSLLLVIRIGAALGGIP